MGGIVRSLFGGSKNKSQSSSTSESSNQAYPYLVNALGGTVSNGVAGSDSLANFLGLHGSSGTANANVGLQNYMNSTGFQNLLKTTTDAIGGSAAAKGLFQSGATGKAITANAQNLAQQSAQNYLGNLQALSQLGLSGAGIIAGAGQKSSSQSQGSGSGNSNNGIFQSIPIFSDRRLKRAVRRLDSIGGIPVYSFKYIWGFRTHIGVLAQDVAQLRPAALGPKIFGFMTVRYDRLFNQEA